MSSYWTIWEWSGAVQTVQGPIQDWVCPAACHGALKVDSPSLATIEELAPDSTVIGENVPSARDALTCDNGREIEEA
jgi:hypothetical protein